jgi:hypothetical protein
MARPRKHSADKRTRKIIVWVTAQEQARYLLNAVCCGLTGPDYIRSVACSGGRELAAVPTAEHEIVLPLPPQLHAALLARAGADGVSPDVLLTGLIAECVTETSRAAAATSSFELIDGLSNVGVSLQRFVPIAESTGYLPDELTRTLDRLDRILDRFLPP